MDSVRLATANDIGGLAAMLARAFAHDPFYAYLAGDAPERGERMRAGWLGILRHASDGLAATWTTDDRAGVAIWHRPGYHGPTFIGSLRMTPAMARLAGGMGRLRDVSRAVAALEARRRVHAPGPHWYLSALGVEPNRQGEGMGTTLVGPALALADASATSAYLETATARNVLLYERLGFALVEELTLPGTDVHGWLMRRPPRIGD